MKYQSLELSVDAQGVARVTMNRPEVHNAFNDEMIAELTACFRQLGSDGAVRAIVLQSRGPSFSAGADIHWMKSMVKASELENKKDSERLAELMRVINFSNKPTVARVQGLALGGGVGLVCCCDVVVAAEEAKVWFDRSAFGPGAGGDFTVCGGRHGHTAGAALFSNRGSVRCAAGPCLGGGLGGVRGVGVGCSG